MTSVFLKSENELSFMQVEVQATLPNSYKISLGDNKQDVKLLELGKDSGVLQLGRRFLPFYYWREEGKIRIWIQGRICSLEIFETPPREKPGADPSDQSFSITSPMPGKILHIHAQTGSSVQANQPLLVMESMKLEMTLSAPFTAKIETIFCKEGDLVEMGQVLIKLSGHGGKFEKKFGETA